MFKKGDRVYFVSDLQDVDFRHWAKEDNLVRGARYYIKNTGGTINTERSITINHYMFPQDCFNLENQIHLF